MKKNSAVVELLVDESGSMGDLRGDTIGSMNTFMMDQAKVPGECDVRVTSFSTSHRIIRKGPIATIGQFTEKDYNPSGGTALYDALSARITSLGDELAARKESDRPDAVIFVVITDGEDNSSGVTLLSIRQMVQHQTDKYGWKFIYLGAGIDAFEQGTLMGINASSVASYNNNPLGYQSAIRSASFCTTSGREGNSVAFSAEQRDELNSAGLPVIVTSGNLAIKP